MRNLVFKKSISFLLLIFISATSLSSAFGQSGQTAFQKQSEEVNRWLKRASVPLKYRTAGNGFEDLQPLKEVLQGVRVIGLGEATHGTREHFQFKHRMAEFLVRELGFTVFAMEAQYFKCLPINEYVLHGSDKDDAAKLINENLSGIYRTEEVLEMVKWIREYNKTVSTERKVKFYGFDVQTPHQAAEFLRRYLKKVDIEYGVNAEKILNETAPQQFQQFWIAYGKRTASQKKLLRGKLFQLIGYLAANETRFVRVSSKADFETAIQAARILLQSDQVRSTPETKQGTDENKRDQFMAETVEYILSREKQGAKMILWAHNFHVWKYESNSNSNSQITKALKKHELLFRPMGNYLKKFFGNEYYSFGFVMDAGSFQAIDDEASDEAIDPQEFTLNPSPIGSIGWYFSQTNLGDCFIDLRANETKKEIADWLTSPLSLRFAGASFSKKWTEDEYSVPVIPRESFDGFVFIENTTRARSLSPTELR